MRTAVCRTDGCVNQDRPVTMPLMKKVYCAGCDTFIKDVTEVTDGNSR